MLVRDDPEYVSASSNARSNARSISVSRGALSSQWIRRIGAGSVATFHELPDGAETESTAVDEVS